MSKLYGEILSKDLLTLDKSFARANGQPLDASEVYYSLEAAQAYAATAQAYIGQKIVVIENGVVTHYSVENTDGALKELGSKPVADGTTVSIDENGKITLANIADKAEGTYNAVLVNGVLTWVKPSETTVEGLNDLIAALTTRTEALETAVGKAAEGDNAATGLFKVIADEIARAEAAESGLGNSLNTFINETYAADKKSLEDEDAKIREIAEEAKSLIDTFLTGTDTDDIVNKLKDIQAELEKLEGAVDLTEEFAAKADKSYVDTELAKKQDIIPANTYDTYGSAAAAQTAAQGYADTAASTAKTEAIDEAANAAAQLYATIETVNGIDGRVANLEKIDHSVYVQNTTLEEHKNYAEETYAKKTSIPAKFSDLTDDSGFDARITAAQNQADKGVGDAAAAKGIADEALAATKTNAEEIGKHATRLETLESAKADHETRIINLEAADTTHAAEFTALSKLVGENKTAIATKAEQADLNKTDAKVATNESAIKTINETTLPTLKNELEGKINNKADASALDNYFTKEETLGITGTVAEGKTLVSLIEEVQTAATKEDNAIKALITAEETRATEAEVALGVRIDGLDAAIQAVLENEDGTALNSIKELALWIEEHDTDVLPIVNKNKEDIAAIIDADTGILAKANKYTDDKIAGIPAATADALGLVKYDNKTIKKDETDHLYVAEVSTDLLVQGSKTLILNGGSADIAEIEE